MFIKLSIILVILTRVPCSLLQKTNFDSVNEFSLNLLQNVAATRDGMNYIISPVTVWSLLTILSEGASGNTYDELVKELFLPTNNNLTRSLFNTFHALLNNNNSSGGSGVLLTHSSAIFIKEQLKVDKDYCYVVKNIYDTDIFSANDSNAETLADDINNYVSYKTQGNINRVIDKDDLDNLAMMIVDAVHFKGDWTYPFQKEATSKSEFYNERGMEIAKVEMMYQNEPNGIFKSDVLKSTVLEMTYGVDRKYSFCIVLPDNGVRLFQVLPLLTIDIFKSMRGRFGVDTVETYIPKLKISSEIELSEPLSYLGILDLFSDRALLPGISSDPLYVSSAKQKANLELNEEGTVADAVSSAGISFRSGNVSPSVVVNRPFIYFIVDNVSGLILFAGAFVSP